MHRISVKALSTVNYETCKTSATQSESMAMQHVSFNAQFTNMISFERKNQYKRPVIKTITLATDFIT